MLFVTCITGLPGLCLKKITVVAVPLWIKDVNNNEVLSECMSGKYPPINVKRPD